MLDKLAMAGLSRARCIPYIALEEGSKEIQLGQGHVCYICYSIVYVYGSHSLIAELLVVYNSSGRFLRARAIYSYLSHNSPGSFSTLSN